MYLSTNFSPSVNDMLIAEQLVDVIPHYWDLVIFYSHANLPFEPYRGLKT